MQNKLYLLFLIGAFGYLQGSSDDQGSSTFTTLVSMNQSRASGIVDVSQIRDDVELANHYRSEIQKMFQSSEQQYLNDKDTRDNNKTLFKSYMDELNNPEATRDRKITILKTIVLTMEVSPEIKKSMYPRKCTCVSWCCGLEYDYCCFKPAAPSDEVIQGHLLAVKAQVRSKIESMCKEEHEAERFFRVVPMIFDQPITRQPQVMER